MEEEKDLEQLEDAEGQEDAEPIDNDEDIDAYIRDLTGRGAKVPASEEKPEEKEKQPEREMFRVTSQIGEDDYRSFIWYSTLLRRHWVLPMFILIPIVSAFLFSYQREEGMFYTGNFVIALPLVVLILAGILVFRCTRWMSRIRKNSPERLLLTDTTIVFMTESAVNIREGARNQVGYKHMTEVHETKKRFILYFDNGKSMLFRKEDMPEDVLAEFRPFIKSKVHPVRLIPKKQ